MNRKTLVVGLVAFLLFPSAAIAKEKESPPHHASVPLYLALGDSLATGVGSSNPERKAYVPRFHRYLRYNLACSRGASSVCKALRLDNIGVSGATTTTLVQNQLPQAIAILQARNQDDNPRNDVEVISIDIGGNDVFPLVNVCAGE